MKEERKPIKLLIYFFYSEITKILLLFWVILSLSLSDMSDDGNGRIFLIICITCARDGKSKPKQ